MRYCTECRFIERHASRVDLSKCGHPSAMRKPHHDRFVAPELDTPCEHDYCSTMRITPCGPDAKLFEPKANTDEADIALAAAIGTGAMK